MTHSSSRASRKPGRACAQGKAFASRIWSEAEWCPQPTDLASATDARLAKAKVKVTTPVFRPKPFLGRLATACLAFAMIACAHPRHGSMSGASADVGQEAEVCRQRIS